MCKIRQTISFVVPVIVSWFLVVCMSGCESQQTAKEKELKARIRRVIVEAWNKGNLDALDELYAPDFVRHRPPFPDYKGLETHKKRVELIRNAYPDHETIIHDVIIDGNTVALWYTWQGTHKGGGLSIPPTGKHVKVAGCDIYRIENGKITEEWDHEGFLSLFQQLGYKVVLPEKQGGE